MPSHTQAMLVTVPWSGVSASGCRAPQSAAAPVRPTLVRVSMHNLLPHRIASYHMHTNPNPNPNQAHARACGRPGSAAVSWWPDRPRLTCGRAPACTMWSFCPGSSEVKNQCFAFDVHKHLRGECWLKQQRGEATRPKDPFFNHTFFPPAMRAADRASWPFAVPSRIWPGPVPERISWTSGVLAPAEEEIISAPPNDRWWERWCARHGPCENEAA